MSELGFRAALDAAGNAVGETGDGDGPVIMLLGHIDTVPGDLPVRIAGGVLHGRGSVDAKGPFAAMVWAAARASARLRGRLIVVGAVGEEGTSPGARHLLSGAPPDAVVIGEPGGAGNVTIGYKGITRLCLRVSRPVAHPSRPEPKAVEAAADVWQDLRARLAERYPGGRNFDRAIPTLMRLVGDQRHAEADITCRTPPGFDGPGFREWLRLRAGTDELTMVEEVPAVRSSRADPVVRSLGAAVRRLVGPPTMKVKLGTSDMNVVGPAWSVPIAAYGPGDSRLDHTDEERMDLTEYLTSIDVLAEALVEMTRTVRPARTAPVGSVAP
jgi:LysW-gamma-L-lysine carboxypeptidase